MGIGQQSAEERIYKLDFTKLSDYREAVRRSDERIAKAKAKKGQATGLNDDIKSCMDVFISDLKGLWGSRREAFLMTYRAVKKDYDEIVMEHNTCVQQLRSTLANDYQVARDSRNLAYEQLTGVESTENEDLKPFDQINMIKPRYDDDGDELWHKVERIVSDRRKGIFSNEHEFDTIDPDEKFIEEMVIDLESEVGPEITSSSDSMPIILDYNKEKPQVVLNDKISAQSWGALIAGIVFAFVDFYFFRQTISQIMDVSTKDIFLSWVIPAFMTIIPLIIMFFFAGPYSTYVKPKRKAATIGSLAIWLVYGLVFVVMRLVVPMDGESMAASVLLAFLFFLVYVIDGAAMFIAGREIWNPALRIYRTQSKRCKDIINHCLALKTEIESKRSEYARVRGNFGSLKMHSVEVLTNFDKPDGFIDQERKHLRDKLISEDLYRGDSNIADFEDPDRLALTNEG